jgi:uncharacterized protein
MSLYRIIRWQPEEGVGLEHLELRETDWGYLAQSTIVGTFEGHDFSCRYEVTLDVKWTFRHLVLEKTDGKVLILKSDGMGTWERANGDGLPEFRGCIDIDIGATPFTNTLPIRRAHLEAGVPQHFRMVWIPLDSLEPFVDEQIYTRRDDTNVHYAAADGSFEADITIDADGLVVDYRGLYHRI